jgi:hypothetical protein
MERRVCARFDTYVLSLDNVHYVDPDDDYDGFCAVQKINELRRAETAFFTWLREPERSRSLALPLSHGDLLARIVTKITSMVDEDGVFNQVNELCEIVAIMLPPSATSAASVLAARPELATQIAVLADAKTHDRASLTSRAIFTLQRCSLVDHHSSSLSEQNHRLGLT